MRTAATIPLLVLVVGCRSNPDQEPLMQLLHGLDDALRVDHEGELRGVPAEERKIRAVLLIFRENVKAIDTFLEGRPALTPRAKDTVDALRETCARQVKLYEGVLLEKRSQLTDEEKQTDRLLRSQFQEDLSRIGRIVDGKE
jgi:hypothetical protein